VEEFVVRIRPLKGALLHPEIATFSPVVKEFATLMVATLQ
jgi:hypothetical protein